MARAFSLMAGRAVARPHRARISNRPLASAAAAAAAAAADFIKINRMNRGWLNNDCASKKSIDQNNYESVKIERNE